MSIVDNVNSVHVLTVYFLTVQGWRLKEMSAPVFFATNSKAETTHPSQARCDPDQRFLALLCNLHVKPQQSYGF
jgi:hypothetical protein